MCLRYGLFFFYSLTWSLCSKSTPPLSNKFNTWVQLPSLTALRNPPSFTVISCKMNHISCYNISARVDFFSFFEESETATSVEWHLQLAYRGRGEGEYFCLKSTLFTHTEYMPMILNGNDWQSGKMVETRSELSSVILQERSQEHNHHATDLTLLMLGGPSSIYMS